MKFDANKIKLCESGHPYVVRMGSNNGIKGLLQMDEQYLNDGNTISFGQDTATMFYQEKAYFTGDKIKILKAKDNRFNKRNAHFFIVAMAKPFRRFAWGVNSFSVSMIEKQKISLPTKDGAIDFDFMEGFIAELEAQRIAELEAQRIAELEAYLSVTGLKDYHLTDEENAVLAKFGSQSFKDFSIPTIFEVKNTHNILSFEIEGNSGTTPYLCASSENNGVSSYISYNKDYKDKGNCIFIGGKTFVVSYQKEDFFSNDSHNLTLSLLAKEWGYREVQLYLATCVNKSLRHKYSWGDSISKSKIKTDKISLPNIGEKPNYETMPMLIRAIQKLVIRDVVEFADSKITATKQICR